MHINAKTHKTYVTHSDVRADFPEVSLPPVLTDEILEELDVYSVKQVVPTYDPITQGVLEIAPAMPIEGHYEQQWEVYDLDPAQVDENIVAAKAGLIEAATAKRWAVMTGGISLPGGMQAGTTIDDQNRITSVVANAEFVGLTDESLVDFKSNSGWVQISIGQVKAIAGAIGQFVQACYSAERQHHEAIDLLVTAQELRAYDVNTGWGQPDDGASP